MNHNTIFSPAEILLPKEGTDLSKWAVVACDQFTSNPDYWENCERIIGDAPSTYRYFLPEAYLDTPKEESHRRKINAAMDAFDPADLRSFQGIIYLQRTLPNGKIRHGMVGKIDLEAYDYNKGSTSPVRATEATVLERIPPRCKIRSEATVELPHILILINDQPGILPFLAIQWANLLPLYDVPLMLGGGRVEAVGVTGPILDQLMEKIAAYEAETEGLVYAMGDGNHSLAAAKSHYENLKAELGDAAKDHPARYALCEITALEDDSLVFEPIYRIVTGVDREDFMTALRTVTAPADSASAPQTVTALLGETEESVTFTDPTHALTVGTLQNFIDDYTATHPGVKCDYIHGEDTVRALAVNETSVGFVFEGMDKMELFPYVLHHGTLPRKTFSMGEAESKRYYLEMREIRG